MSGGSEPEAPGAPYDLHAVRFLWVPPSPVQGGAAYRGGCQQAHSFLCLEFAFRSFIACHLGLGWGGPLRRRRHTRYVFLDL